MKNLKLVGNEVVCDPTVMFWSSPNDEYYLPDELKPLLEKALSEGKEQSLAGFCRVVGMLSQKLDENIGCVTDYERAHSLEIHYDNNEKVSHAILYDITPNRRRELLEIPVGDFAKWAMDRELFEESMDELLGEREWQDLKGWMER